MKPTRLQGLHVKFHQTSKSRKTQEKWYQKLQKSGFKDIEDGENYLKTWDSFQGPDQNPLLNSAKADYYGQARHFLAVYDFKYKYHKQMFEMHTEGLGYRKIAKKHKTYKNKVASIIQGYVKVMRGSSD